MSCGERYHRHAPGQDPPLPGVTGTPRRRAVVVYHIREIQRYGEAPATGRKPAPFPRRDTIAHVVRIERRDAFLHATVTGDNTAEDVRGYLAEVRAACVEHRCRRVLIEESLAGPGLKTMTIYDIVTLGVTDAASVLEKVAFLDLNPAHDPHGMEFAEDLAMNRALNARFFTDRRLAEEWLRE